MIIKQADDQTKRLALLEGLQLSTLLDADQKEWLKDQLWALRMGRSGETNAAYYIDSLLKDSKNLMVLHDLRLVADGDVAQIDHLIINRFFEFYLLETKRFSGDVHINEHGEYTVAYGQGMRKGIPSPLEQSKRHERILHKVLNLLEITGRTTNKPRFTHLVLIDPRGNIKRPDPKRCDTSHVIKADQFPSWFNRHVERETGALQAVGDLLNIRSSDTLQMWAEKISRQHCRADPLELPEFMKPRAKPLPMPLAASPAVNPVSKSATSEALVEGRKRCICSACGVKISFAEAKFCWGNPHRFGGLQYCREHQNSFPVRST